MMKLLRVVLRSFAVAALTFFAGATAHAITGTNGSAPPFRVNDANDHGCPKTPANVGSECRGCSQGMPAYSVSLPYVSVWVSDEPAFYTTSLGEEIGLILSYAQRDTRPKAGSMPENQDPFVPITGWNHNWFSYIHFSGDLCAGCYSNGHLQGDLVNFFGWQATVYARGGGEYSFAYTNKVDAATQLSLLPMDGDNYHVCPNGFYSLAYVAGDSPSSAGGSGFRMIYPDGSQDLYGQVTEMYFYESLDQKAYADALLTEHIDPYGNSVRLSYTNALVPLGLDIYANRYLLHTITDYDGRVSTLSYDTNYHLMRVDMPYGRAATFHYSDEGAMDSITDAQGMTSTMAYDSTNSTGFLTNLITLYGTNTFIHTDLGSSQDGQDVGNAGGSNRVSRAVTVVLPDGSKELYAYRYDSSEVGIPAQLASPVIPTNTPIGTLDDSSGTNDLAAAYLRNSFHWDRRQYAALSTGTITDLTTNDYALATMTHWLVSATNGWLSEVPSWSRLASPDGVRQGQVTWFDYEGKTNSAFVVGTNSQPGVVALVQPNGATSYSWTRYNKFRAPITNVATYTTPSGAIGKRTNTWIYTDLVSRETGTNNISVNWTNAGLVQVLGPEGESRLALSGYTNDTTTTKRNGAVYTNTRPRQFVLSVTNAVTNVTTVFFNQRQQVTGAKRPAGLTSTNLYGTNGFLSQTLEIEIGRSNSFVFTNGLLSIRTNELGLVTQYSSDNLQRLTSVGFPDGTTVSNTYDRLNLSGRKDRLGNWSHATFDLLGHMTNFIDSLSRTTKLTYCYCGALESITDPLGNITSFARDYDGQVTAVVSSTNYTRYYNRNLLGQVTNLSDTAGLNVNYAYNLQGLVTNVWTSYGNLFSANYNIHDWPSAVVNAEGVRVTNAFDLLGRTLFRSHASNIVEQFVYSASGLASYSDPLLHTTYFGYDPAARLTSVTNAKLEIVQFAYDPANDLVRLVDGRTNATSWTYNSYRLLIAKTNANNNPVFTNGFDANQRLTRHWTPAKGLASFVYDAAGNRLTNIYPTLTTSAVYDELNRLKTMVDSIGTSQFTYTNFGAFDWALASETGPWPSSTVSYGYANRLETSLGLSLPNHTTWAETFGYDGELRFSTINSPAGGFGYNYYGAGGLIQTLSLPGGNYITNAYDNLAELRGTWLKSGLTNPALNTLNYHGYDYNLDGLRTNAWRTDGSRANLDYDAIGQIVRFTGLESNGTPRLNENFGYGFDPAGNLFSRTNGTLIQSFLPDAINQLSSVTRTGTLTVAGSLSGPVSSLTVNGQGAAIYADLTYAVTNGLGLSNGINTFVHSVTDPRGSNATKTVTANLPVTVSFTWDANGNLIYDGVRVFDYDDLNRLIRITVTNAWKAEFVYDGLGRRRIRRDYNAAGSVTNETRTICDQGLKLQERDGNNNVKYTLTRGPDFSGTIPGAGGIGGLLARTDGNGSAFYHADGAGNITAMINAQGNVVAWYLYGGFGALLAKRGPLADPNTIRFSSMEDISPAGLVAYPSRFYEPTLSRWLTPDPVGEAGGLNLYGFVGNNPMGQVDPMGLSTYFSHNATFLGIPLPWSAVPYRVPTNPHSLLDQAEALLALPAVAILDAAVGLDAAGSAFTRSVTGMDLADTLNSLGPAGGPEAGLINSVEDAVKFATAAAAVVEVEDAAKIALQATKPCIKAAESGVFSSGGDRLLGALGPASLNHAEELAATIERIEGAGGNIAWREGEFAFSPAAGQPGRVILDPNASISAVRHEAGHFFDDLGLGHPGMGYYIQNPEVRWASEYSSYIREINLARRVGDRTSAWQLLQDARAERTAILGR
jgi:RHS repeat-associated protein